MIHLYQSFWNKLHECNLDESGVEKLIQLTESKLIRPVSGDFPRWNKAYEQLPQISVVHIDEDRASVHCDAEIENGIREQISSSYQQLIPWRKGPFEMFSTHIDSEWQSNMKWERIEKYLPDLSNKLILDVGCGNGFYMFKMCKYKPRLIIGIDPGLLQIIQFWSIEKYYQSGFAVLPVTMNDFPGMINNLDIVFSMGVLYHRKSPIHHIKQLADTLKPGGSVILETLIIDGDETTCLIPHGRYAQMRNVWFLPSVAMLKIMLERNGFENIHCVDISQTTTEEQRTTEWMKFQSLKSFLNEDQTRTVEGYQLPTRATLIATKK